MVEASTTILLGIDSIQAGFGLAGILLSFEFISDDIESIVFGFIASQVLYMVLSNDILQFVAGVI